MALSTLCYEIQFENRTNSAYHFGVYQDLSTSTGLDSVIWQVRGLPPRSTNKVTWSMNYGVAITDWDENDGDYSGMQIVDAQLGKTYHVKVENGDIPTIDSIPTESDSSDSESQIKLFNGTTISAKLGFAINNSLIARTENGKTQWATYVHTDHPTFWVALYQYIKCGDLPNRNIQVDPIKVAFTDGNKKALVESYTENGRDILRIGALSATEDREIFTASRRELTLREEELTIFRSGKTVHEASEKKSIFTTIKRLLPPMPRRHIQKDSEDDESAEQD